MLADPQKSKASAHGVVNLGRRPEVGADKCDSRGAHSTLREVLDLFVGDLVPVRQAYDEEEANVENDAGECKTEPHSFDAPVEDKGKHERECHADRVIANERIDRAGLLSAEAADDA